MTTQFGKLLRVHISESDSYQGQPLFEAIIAKCREFKISGATVFRGLEGYGESAEMHRARLGRRDQPIVIVIADTSQNVDRLALAIEDMLDTGVLATSEVEIIRVQRS